MQFNFKPFDETSARAVADWRYDGVYAFYDMPRDAEDLGELLDPANWPDKYFAALDEHDELVGFFCYERAGDTVTIGLGLRPDCTGRGWGQAFVEAGLALAREKFKPAMFRLIVATFNRRAIKVYERVGFNPDGVFMRDVYGTQHEFLRMVMNA